MIFAALPAACVAPVSLGGGDADGNLTESPRTALPAISAHVPNLVPTVRGDSVGIDFDPVDDAVDYRVYPLPRDGDVQVGADGFVTVKNAIYRCAGSRHTFDLQNDLTAGDSRLVRTRGEFSWNATVPPEPRLGYVYATAGPGRLPAYALAGKAGNDEAGWRESRTKIYTTNPGERDQLLSQGYRNDGIVFYVPSAESAEAPPGSSAASSSETRTVYTSVDRINGGPDEVRHYFTDGSLADREKDAVAPAATFEVLVDDPGTQDSKALFVVGYGNVGHDELAVGKERFARASHQGQGPLWHLEWSGLREKTTLVVEALDSGCPYQGLLAASHLEAPPHQTFWTLDEVAKGAPAGEVFVNGQFDVTTRPRAVARSFVTVEPAAPAAWDFYEGFDGNGALDGAVDVTLDGCFRCVARRSSKFDTVFSRIDFQSDKDVLSYGEVMGQLWLSFDDNEGGTLGRGDFTVRQKTRVSDVDDEYLHVTFAANSATTLRRFPQLVVSDQDAPQDPSFRSPDNDSVVLQVRGGPEVNLQLYAVHGLPNGSPWAVDNPDSHSGLLVLGAPERGVASPAEPLFEHVGLDRMTTFDVYLSKSRLYAFVDGQPFGCATLPDVLALAGPVAVTLSDVFFHEGAEPEVCEAERPYDFLHRHSCRETFRRFDDLGFKSGATLPRWDEAQLPCRSF